MSAKLTLHQITVTPEQANQRLDKFLAGSDFIPSRSRASELIERGLVRLNGRILKPSYKVQAGEQLTVEIPISAEPSDLQPLNAPLIKLYEDQDLVVINKPAGLVIHPAAGHAQDTLVNILLHHVDQLSMGFNEQRPGIVHRLDRDTSGVLVVAKNDRAHTALSEQFRQKTVHRIYWAVVNGVPSPQKRTLRSNLARDPRNRKKFASSNSGGKIAITHYQVLKTHPTGVAWVECRLETGRTHQIRVHLSEAGYPIVHDPIYSRSKRLRGLMPSRLCLHACELGFVHPRTAETLFFHAEWPEDLKTLVTHLGFVEK